MATWLALLRCEKCHEAFTVKGILPEKIADIADTTKCPHCGHEPAKQIPGVLSAGKRHLIVSLAREEGQKS
jgi:NAD-dependent SIR2 family protein deacetylase